MAAIHEAPSANLTVADLIRRLGDVPLERVRLRPAPGTATVRDVIEIEARENRLFELVDGVLVEKVMGYDEGGFALYIGTLLNNFVLPRKMGKVVGADGMMRLFPKLLRIPDVSFTTWERIRKCRSRGQAAPLLSPNLAVEVLSKSNTRAEMKRKRIEYFKSGTELVWEVDPAKETVIVYTSPTTVKKLVIGDTLVGDPVLAGFSVSLEQLFSALDDPG